MAMDVAIADRLYFSTPGRECRERHVSNCLCFGGAGFRMPRTGVTEAIRPVAVNTRGCLADGSEGQQPAAAFALVCGIVSTDLVRGFAAAICILASNCDHFGHSPASTACFVC